ncbi:DUF317 domain-containing protein [Streptomyces sp. NPDC059604]|uniref:DUF317 domain-containing protein n=1 Tax=Streptomyces sp. NPDC059604 TaxID=3346881 RepID=UPI0036889365
MPATPSVDAHVLLDTHDTHPSAVTAVLSGAQAYLPRLALEAANWAVIAKNRLVLARIDHEEPYWAERAAQRLEADGITVEITDRLREAMAKDWTWANYPMPWCSRQEIREVSDAAQRIHDDIAEGRLIIHLHADDGHTTVAAGSYVTGVHRHVHLHGENHLRQETGIVFGTEAEAVAEFHRLYSVAVRPGPAPLTDLEQAVRRLLAGKFPATTADHAPAPSVEPPVAEPGEHEAFLQTLFAQERRWERYRPFDETTIASHESLTARAEFDHEARHRTDVAWTIAEYHGPVGERLWHAAITVATPIALIHTILQHLDAPPLAAGEAHDILREAGWHPASNPARTTWTAAGGAITFEHTPHSTADRWTLYGGEDLDNSAWTIRISAGAGGDLLAELASTATVLVAAPTPTPAPQPTPAHRLPASVPQPRAPRR